MVQKKVFLCYLRLKKVQDPLWEYTGLFYLAGALLREGHEALVWHEDWMGAEKAILEHRPDVIGFSCDAENQHFLTGFIPRIRRKLEEAGCRPFILAGGPQAMALGEDFLRKSTADAVLRGEGDETLPALAAALEENTLPPSKTDIPGLVWLDRQGCFHENPGIGIAEDLRALPRPAYQASLHQRIYGRVVFTARGCPFSCAFCASNVGHGKVRRRDIQDVLDEIRENLARESRIRYLIIQDDMFCTSVSRVREFCAGMRGIRKMRPLVWFCETHVQTLLHHPELLREMVDSGLVRLQIGMESGDPAVLKLYNKQVTPGEVLDLVRMAVETGLPQIAGNFIIGGPPEEKGVTEAFIRQLLREGAGVVDISTGFLRSYPCTAISRDPAAFGLRILSEDRRTAGDDFPGVIPIGSTEAEIVALRQKANRAIREEIGLCIRERRLPLARAMTQFRLQEKYGISSRWMMEIQSREIVYEYYRMVYLEEGQPYEKTLPPAFTYPQRTFQFYRSVIARGGIARLDGLVLSPLEYDILFFCAGKLSISEITEALFPKYGEAYMNKTAFLSAIGDFLERAEKRYWITVFVFRDCD